MVPSCKPLWVTLPGFAKKGNSVDHQSPRSGFIICTVLYRKTRWDWHILSIQANPPNIWEQWHAILLGPFLVSYLPVPVLGHKVFPLPHTHSCEELGGQECHGSISISVPSTELSGGVHPHPGWLHRQAHLPTALTWLHNSHPDLKNGGLAMCPYCPSNMSALNTSPTSCFHLILQWAGNTQLHSRVNFANHNGGYLRAKWALTPLEGCRTWKEAFRLPIQEHILHRASCIHTTNTKNNKSFLWKCTSGSFCIDRVQLEYFSLFAWGYRCINIFRWKKPKEISNKTATRAALFSPVFFFHLQLMDAFCSL